MFSGNKPLLADASHGRITFIFHTSQYQQFDQCSVTQLMVVQALHTTLFTVRSLSRGRRHTKSGRLLKMTITLNFIYYKHLEDFPTFIPNIKAFTSEINCSV
ncbi:hypothetical protein I79_014571 [Cricetulus griseus]|uniref:Uncharacterized protein n=1 Tax=Cricetulus griseus TaxID=10029 RepID=G3HUG2_CRIGR|nr:hypothetical protein I79_014571 [Cricetulus griseus]